MDNKEYNEALQRAKELHEAGNALTKKQMEIVFPQLAESGDEKIRKFLIDYFTSYKIGNVATKLNGYRIDDILAYLEKQKEQKPVEYLDKDKVYAIMKKLHELAFSQLIPIDSEEYKQIGEITKDVRDLLDYPIEQKPVDFPTTDEEVNEFLETHPKVEVPEKYKTPDFVFSKQEYESYPIISKDTTSVKPEEWSEEDENMAYFVNQFLEYHELSDPTAKSCKKWFNNRFKSLRNRVGKEFLQPHWKPSEEQMKALNAINCHGGLSYVGQQLQLISLYNNLKNLM